MHEERHYGYRGPRRRGRNGPGPEAGYGPGRGGKGRGRGWAWGDDGPIEAMFGGGRPFGRYVSARGSRARRGDVRAAILDLLAEGRPWNGYQIIQEISERTNGVWRPSAGSVYPALQQLEDEGLIATEDVEGRRRMYQLTDEGRAYAEAHADELRSSWDAVAGMADDVALELRDLFRQVMMAVMEVARAGTDVQVVQARKVLTETRRSLYRILAADDPGQEPGTDRAAGTSGDGTGTAGPVEDAG